MKDKFFYWYLLFLTIGIASQTHAQKLVEIGKGYSSTSVNTTVFRANSIVTYKDYQYVSYYNEDGYLTLAKRKLGETVWEKNVSGFKGHVADAHNVISMMVDGDGYLHVAFDHHGHPLKYCRSIYPESIELGELQPMTGLDEQNVTYPEFYKLKEGSLLFAYRSGSSGRGNLVLNKYDIKKKQWEKLQSVLIDGENKRNAYWQLYVDRRGIIHLSWVWRETWLVETNHDLCYARSTDGGHTWEKSTGEQYVLPITSETAEYACRIPQNSELINQTSMTADSQGHPYIASYWRDKDSEVPQYRIVWHDGKTWQQQQVSERVTPFTLSGGGTKSIPISRPRLAVKEDGDNLMAYYIFRDAERGSKVSVALNKSLTKNKWTFHDLTDFSVDAWEPSFDTILWEEQQQLHIFVQKTQQGDGEKAIQTAPEPVYVLEVTDF